MAQFQTLSEFLTAPFGRSDLTERLRMEEAYNKGKKGIKVIGYTVIEDNYLIHLQIPSESNKKQMYDVVILFFTDENKVKRSVTFKDYYIKLFSNSPSFIFQYAAMYNQEGFLIDFLAEKTDKEYIGVLPKKPKELSYDKSIYFACRYLNDDKLTLLNKFGIITRHKKNPEKFFRDIKSFSDVKFTNEVKTLDKKLDKELKENKKAKKESKKNKTKNKTGNNKIKATDHTGVSTGIKMIKKIKATKSTKRH